MGSYMYILQRAIVHKLAKKTADSCLTGKKNFPHVNVLIVGQHLNPIENYVQYNF